MTVSRIKNLIQLSLSLGIAGWIFWYLYKDIEVSSLWSQLKSSNWIWIGTSLSIAWMGFWIRGWRWSLLIQDPTGSNVSPTRAYHALMVGYLTNLLVPRAGELVRCGMLSKTNQKPIGHLIGTVLLERSIDLLFLIGTILLAFLIENQLFTSLASQLVDIPSLLSKISSNWPFIVAGLIVFGLMLYFFFSKYRNHGLVAKVNAFARQMLSGIKSIQSLSNPKGFWMSSLSIWIIYFLTMATVALGITSTANLTYGEVLLVMVMGSIGMVAPVQGGIGTFHALVAYILIQFGVVETDAKIFAAIIHGTQVLLVLIAGLYSWIYLLRVQTKQPN